MRLYFTILSLFLALAVSLVAGVGHAFDLPILAQWFSYLVPMQPNVAIGLFASGLALLAIPLKLRTLVLIISSFTFILGIASVLSYFLPISIETLFLNPSSAVDTPNPGQPSLPAAFSIICNSLFAILSVTKFKNMYRHLVHLTCLTCFPFGLALHQLVVFILIYDLPTNGVITPLALTTLCTIIFLCITKFLMLAHLIKTADD